jgi:2-dehydropantoate 2-reductase
VSVPTQATLRAPVVVLGAGAVGGTVGGGLLLGRHEVVFVDPWFQNVETIRRRGLALTVDGERRELQATALYLDELDRMEARPEVVLLACKSYDTETMVRLIEPYLAQDGFVVSLQNGINEDRIASLVGPGRTVGCVVHYNAAMPDPAHAVRLSPSGWHSFTVGELDGRENERCGRVTALLDCAGPAVSTTDIFGVLWAKLAFNCMTNALTASTGLATPELWASEVAQGTLVRIGAEAALVARAQGREMQPLELVATSRELPPDLLVAADAGDESADREARTLMTVEATTRAAATSRAPGASSMLQDIRKGRRPEIDHLNGYVVREGRRYGIATPANDAVAELARAVALGELPQDPAHLDGFTQTWRG